MKTKKLTYIVFQDNWPSPRLEVFRTTNPIAAVNFVGNVDYDDTYLIHEIMIVDNNGIIYEDEINAFDLALAIHAVFVFQDLEWYHADRLMQLRVSPLGLDLDHEENKTIKRIVETLVGYEVAGKVY
jgi:hypothetical protein